ncbi:MAG TPA: hypothetical protein VGJ94_15890 [Syntrophorhabdaceae bacterium]|jgi:hypothetical protein
MDQEANNAYDRIMAAQQKGEISMKESVLLRAKLLFAPHLMNGSKFARRGNEAVVADGLTGFYKDVHKVFPQLSVEERNFLRSLSPDLKTIIDAREKEDASSSDTNK